LLVWRRVKAVTISELHVLIVVGQRFECYNYSYLRSNLKCSTVLQALPAQPSSSLNSALTAGLAFAPRVQFETTLPAASASPTADGCRGRTRSLTGARPVSSHSETTTAVAPVRSAARAVRSVCDSDDDVRRLNDGGDLAAGGKS
jgi:hypothetical protein